MAAMPPRDPVSLKQRALRAGGWRFAAFGLAQAIRLGSTLIMTRLLAPDMFGVMAIALMVTVVLSMLSDIGVHQNIVQSRRGDDPVFLDTAWIIQIIRGVILWLVALSLSFALHLASLAGMLPAHSAYASPVLPLVLAVCSVTSVIHGFQSTKIATAYRRLDQKRLIQIELIGQLAATAIMVLIGVATRSIWALVVGALIMPMTMTVLSHLWLRGNPNRFRWDRTASRELTDFGRWIFISSAVGILAVHGDRLLLGGLVDAQILGLYAIAFLVVGVFELGIARLHTSVALPALSEIARNDPSRLREVYYKLRVPGDLLLLLVAGGLFASGQWVIDVLYDSRYSGAGAILEILALRLFVVRYGLATQLYLALGLPRHVMVISVVRFVALYSVVPLLYYLGGLQAAIWGIALNALAIVPFVYRFDAKLGLIDFRRELAVLPALPAGFVCGLALNLLRV